MTGLGSVSLALPGLPDFSNPTIVEFVAAIVIGVVAAVVASGIRRLALAIRPTVERRLVPLTAVAGVAVALVAIGYTYLTGKTSADVLFSGQSDLPTLIANRAEYAWGTLLALIICKAIAYGISLAAFRGGPVFPAMFIGAALGLLMSTVTGMQLAPAIGMGIGALCAAMLRLPLTSVLLATVLLAQDGLAVMPVVIVAVVVSYMTTIWLSPPPAPAEPAVAERAPAPAPGPGGAAPA